MYIVMACRPDFAAEHVRLIMTSPRRRLPDFRDYIYTEGLEKAKPQSVNIR
jgi:hypothetical protein